MEASDQCACRANSVSAELAITTMCVEDGAIVIAVYRRDLWSSSVLPCNFMLVAWQVMPLTTRREVMATRASGFTQSPEWGSTARGHIVFHLLHKKMYETWQIGSGRIRSVGCVGDATGDLGVMNLPIFIAIFPQELLRGTPTNWFGSDVSAFHP